MEEQTKTVWGQDTEYKGELIGGNETQGQGRKGSGIVGRASVGYDMR